MRPRTLVALSSIALAGVVYAVARRGRLRATAEERRTPMAGDDLVDRPQVSATRAIDIAARRELVWPWLVQMGYGRAGWYGYDWLDNAGERSAGQIVPELQNLAVGDVVPIGPDGGGFIVERMEAARFLLLTLRRPNGAVSVAIKLEETGFERTRMLVRLRLRVRPTPAGSSFLAMMGTGDLAILRAAMLGIKHRAEAAKEEQLDRMDLADVPEA